MENTQEEVWKDVVGYEGVYKVSSCGKLKRIYKTKKDAKGKPAFEYAVFAGEEEIINLLK